MISRRMLGLVAAAVLLVLTYLLVQGTVPDAARHERTLDSFRTLLLANSALQRDVLRARAGMLGNYDPLVLSITQLRSVSAALTAGEEAIAAGERHTELGTRVEALGTAVAELEELAEEFKSRNALLHNSLSFFRHQLREINTQVADSRQGEAARAIASLASAMLRFDADPAGASAAEMRSALDRLEQEPDWLNLERSGRTAGALVSHGRVIVYTLPMVDGLMTRLLAHPAAERVRAVQDAYLVAYGRSTERAGFFRALIYAAAVGLAAYVGHLFLRLRLSTQVLAERLSFERLISSVSARFIDLTRERICLGIEEGLAQVARHARVERAHILILGAKPDLLERSFSWSGNDCREAACSLEDLLAATASAHSCQPGTQDIICETSVASLPPGPTRLLLQGTGIRSWLSIRMRHAGRSVGFFILATTTSEKHWAEDDVGLFRTASEIFATAIARERSEREREELEVRLQHKQRLEAIGAVAGGIAHEFNNILGAVRGYGEMAAAALRRNGAARQHIEQILKAGERAQAVVDQVLSFSRRRGRRVRPILAEPVVREAIAFVRASFSAGPVIERNFEAGPTAILSDPTELQQVVMNLCTNAAQATGRRGTVTVGLSRVETGAELVLSHGQLRAGRYLRVSIADTGGGIEPAILGRIFEPFFTTKPDGEGTGLGLATVHGIVAQHGGAMNVESRPGVGSTFEAYFPRTDSDNVAELGPARQTPVLGNGETVLVVDGDRPLVHSCEEMLASVGYEPVGFDSGPAALAAFRADPDRFDLVLVGEALPGMSAVEFTAALRAIVPEIPLVLMAASTVRSGPNRPASLGVHDILTKPLQPALVARCLARHLVHAREPLLLEAS